MRLSRLSVATVVSVGALVALTAALWILLLQPRIATAATVKQQSVQVEQANLTLLKRHRDILDMAAQAPAMAREAQRIFSAMPQTAQLPQVMQQINDAARASGISARNIALISTSIPKSLTSPDPSSRTPGTPASPGTAVAGAAATASSLGVNLATMSLEVSVTGTSAQRAAFLGRLQALHRGFLITAHSAVAEGLGKDTGMLTVNGTMFVLESRLPDLVANAQSIIARAQRQAAVTAPAG